MMKHYNSYKDSGIEWIGEIPSHWDNPRLKFLISETYGGEVIDKSFWGEGVEILYTTSKLIHKSNYDKFNYDRRTTTRDLLLSRNGDGVVHIPPDGCIYTNVVQLVRIKNGYDRRFLYYILTQQIQPLNSYSDGDFIVSLNKEQWFNLFTPHPSLKEQEQIVSFLDDKTTKIDELIQNKLRKIDLLKEYRTSLINTVVTKGLNPNVPMKDSGIEWIGEIPSHWEKSRLDFLFRLYGRVGWKSLKSDEYVEDGYVFLSTPNIKDKVIDYVNVNYITKERYDESPEIMLENGDVLLVKDGSTLGIVNIVVDLPRPSTVNSSIGVLKKISDKISPMFMYYHLTSDYHQNIINRIKGGMGVPHLFQSDIKKFDVILPLLSEQEHIVSYLDEKTSQIDKTIDIEKKKIELLKEYRQSLISSVVTGKIKVIE